MNKVFSIFLIIASLAFTGCSDKNNTSILNSDNNINTSENISSEQYNISGYWKVTSKEINSGYYIIEFKDNNTMIEYFPKNNTLKSTYEIKNSSINKLTILTSSDTLINLEKIDDSNMNLVYDNVIEHATKISKVDFNKLLNDLSESKDNTIIYNSNYYQKHNENYTNVEQNNLSIEENNTNIQENNTYIEENNINIEENDTYIEENNTNIEENDTYIEENNTNIEENNTDIEQNDVSIEEDNTDIED